MQKQLSYALKFLALIMISFSGLQSGFLHLCPPGKIKAKNLKTGKRTCMKTADTTRTAQEGVVGCPGAKPFCLLGKCTCCAPRQSYTCDGNKCTCCPTGKSYKCDGNKCKCCPAGQDYTCASPGGKCGCCPAGKRMAGNVHTGKSGCFAKGNTMLKKPDWYIGCPNVKPSCFSTQYHGAKCECCPPGQSYTCVGNNCGCCPAGKRMAQNPNTGNRGCFEKNNTRFLEQMYFSFWIGCPNIKPSCVGTQYHGAKCGCCPADQDYTCDGINCKCCPAGQRMAANANTGKFGCFEEKNTMKKPDGSGWVGCPNIKPSCAGNKCKCCPAGQIYQYDGQAYECCSKSKRLAFNLITKKSECFDPKNTLLKPHGRGWIIGCPNAKPSCDGDKCKC